ncbi:NBS-LRR type resistance protein [Cucumis melo var. makuwa]|uniref:NBS-LRR type resistance protein n=1 Tax=Cucumis melo var. makuwa TaxID=1194695 RepID=A0A5D3DRV9_CUCMM|nr:NBS-LRR type resistance protein [Cucumis melo var. makuwa]TYK26314.1 NBS-LRR type resistance protein [Cucumis melo var. makuwa]
MTRPDNENTSNKIHQRKHKENQMRPYGLHASFLPLVGLPLAGTTVNFLFKGTLRKQSSSSVERTHQSRDPEGCTYQSSDPKGTPISLVIPKDAHISLVIPKDAHINLVIPKDAHISLVIPKDAHISLVIPKDTPIRKIHYPIDEANRYPSVHTELSTTVTLRQHSYYNFAIGFASQIV